MRGCNNLGINIDHVATIREARRTYEPDPLQAAYVALANGADSITIHLREDRRHINDNDVRLIREKVHQVLNLEMSVAPGIVRIAETVGPDQVCLVPEKRREVTTEGGLDVKGDQKTVQKVVVRMKRKRIRVSLFIDPDEDQVQAAFDAGADMIEIHTGTYANKKNRRELRRIFRATEKGLGLGLIVNAGHGLNYHNIIPLAEAALFYEFNIGHAIIARAVFAGLGQAVRDMRDLIDTCY